MSDARDEREWLEKGRRDKTRDSICSPGEEIGEMHFATENFSTALEYFRGALEQTDLPDYPDRFRLLTRISDCHRKRGDYPSARQCLEDARALPVALPEEAVGRIEYREGYLLLWQGAYDAALKTAFGAYRRLKRSQSHSEVAYVQLLVANCYQRLGLVTEAEEFFMDALSSYRRAEDRVGIAYVYNSLGLLHKNACRWTRALASLSKSLDIAKTLGLSQHLIVVQLNIGVVHAKLRRFEDAISAFDAAAASAERFGDQASLTRALLMLGRTQVARGALGRGEKALLRAQAMAVELGYEREAALADEYIGELMMARNDLSGARANLVAALDRARRLSPEGDVVAECLRRMADVQYRLGQPNDALASIEEGLRIATSCGELYEIGFFHRGRALCRARLGEMEGASEAMLASIATFAEQGNAFEKVVSQQLLARICTRIRSEAALLRAKSQLADSVVELGNVDEPHEFIVSQVLLAGVERRLGNLDEALLAVYEADRVASEEDNARFRRALGALRRRVEGQMSNATRRVLDQFSVLGEMQSGARSREQLAKGLDSTLALIVEKLGAQGGFIAVPATKGKALQIISRQGMTAKDAQAVESWYGKRADRGTVIVADIAGDPAVADLRERLSLRGTLLVQDLGFEREGLGALCVFKEADGPVGQDDLHFVAAYSSIISLSVYELLRTEERGRAARPRTNAGKGFESIVTDNREMIHLLNLAERVAHSDATVLLQGETGTGKGLIAYAVHLLSERRDRAFVHVNCAALPEHLLESELFGHVRGAFTNAYFDKDGLLIEANGGTIFLDEIGKTSLAMQGKLLHFLDSGKVRKVGSNDLMAVDVRVVCASKGNLLGLVEEGKFLEDFFYRINDFPLTVPPLRARREDIPLLMHHYIAKLSREMEKSIDSATPEFTGKLVEYNWPGNVRELEKVIKRAIILADDGDSLDVRHLAPEVLRAPDPEMASVAETATLRERIEQIEQAMIMEAMRRLSGNKSQVATHLGISYPNLLSKIKRYNIQ
ncbi:MAG: sigma 54-interacting transcriptional regulator [Candidatus Krumholzibacteria bacterium]|nr:sigma 54-interacting transcriptional regulator [Candidatus Krumholzibacteria bacterium]MDH4336278.1 sigma 54-interacting transcriptional regulator [Candidatus Krumholzibacteria bacterium]